MTKEEAAEIILRGDRYQTCSACVGRGTSEKYEDATFYGYPDYRNKATNNALIREDVQVMPRCRHCRGRGKTHHPAYLVAMRLLDIPPGPFEPLKACYTANIHLKDIRYITKTLLPFMVGEFYEITYPDGVTIGHIWREQFDIGEGHQ